MKRIAGIHERSSVAGEVIEAFIPHPLPPAEPPLRLNEELKGSLTHAQRALGRLEIASALVPSIDWFIYAFVRKEAVLSSQIEGTQATLVDLLSFEARSELGGPDADIEEVCNYLDALKFARDQLQRPDGLPLSLRLLNQTHGILLRGVRGTSKGPGEIRRSQNWIGGTRPGNAAFIPPPPHRLSAALSDLERFIHDESDLPPLIRIGLVHAQFETLHPYLDGNGRLGRLLITLLMEHWGLLPEPLLYLSLFLKRHRHLYYDRLNATRHQGDWEGWLTFFLEGVATIAREASITAQELFTLVGRDRARLLQAPNANVASLRLFEILPHHPVQSVTLAMQLLGASRPTAGKALEVLAQVGILIEVTGKKRGRIFHYAEYLEKLREGTELP